MLFKEEALLIPERILLSHLKHQYQQMSPQSHQLVSPLALCASQIHCQVVPPVKKSQVTNHLEENEDIAETRSNMILMKIMNRRGLHFLLVFVFKFC